jgi:hypothetical protein
MVTTHYLGSLTACGKPQAGTKAAFHRQGRTRQLQTLQQDAIFKEANKAAGKRNV